MNLPSILDPEVSKTLSLILAHFLWQGTLLAVVAGGWLRCLRGRTAQSRYLVCLATLLLMLTCLPATFAVLWKRETHPALRNEVPEASDGDLTDGTDPLAKLESRHFRPHPSETNPRSEDRNAGSAAADAGQPLTMSSGVDVARSNPGSLDDTPLATTGGTREIWGSLGLFVCGAYLVGLFVMTARLFGAAYGGRRLCSRAAPIDDPRLLRVIERVTRQLGLRRDPLVAFCRRVTTPAVVGFVQPVVLLPVTLATGLSRDQFRLVIAHELAHLRRYDHLVLLLQRIIETALFFHPAMWIVSRRLRMERERCCDDAVLAAENTKWDYVETLVRVAELRCGDSQTLPHLMALEAAGDPSDLRRRIARLVDEPIEPTMRLTRCGALLLTLFVCLMVLSPAVLSSRAGQPVLEEADFVEQEADKRTDNAAPADQEQTDRRKKSRSQITISKETTFVTKHLTRAGYPDYRAALNEHYSKGVTADNNALVSLLRAGGPKPEGYDLPDAFYEKLGIERLPEQGDYSQDLYKYVQDVAKKSNPPQDGRELYDKIQDKWTAAMEAPWQAKDAPLLVDWLRKNEKPLALVAEGVQRPHYYHPWVAEKEGLLITQLLPTVQSHRETARQLQTRAMLRIGSGDLDRAWSDLLTMYRLGRLVSRGPSLVEGLVGIAIDGMAAHGTWKLAQHDKLTAEQALRMQKELAALPPINTVVESINYTERMSFLDIVQDLARREDLKQFREIVDFLGDPGDEDDKWVKEYEPAIRKIAEISKFRWDDVLRRGNYWFDRLVAASAKGDYTKRQEALQKLYDELDKTMERLKQLPEIAEKFPMGINDPDEWVAHKIADALAALLTPALDACTNAETRSHSYAKASRLALALAAYRSDTGSYPAKITALAPKYISKLPTDPVGSPVIYEADGDSYSLTIKDPAGHHDVVVGKTKK